MWCKIIIIIIFFNCKCVQAWQISLLMKLADLFIFFQNRINARLLSDQFLSASDIFEPWCDTLTLPPHVYIIEDVETQDIYLVNKTLVGKICYITFFIALLSFSLNAMVWARNVYTIWHKAVPCIILQYQIHNNDKVTAIYILNNVSSFSPAQVFGWTINCTVQYMFWFDYNWQRDLSPIFFLGFELKAALFNY